MRRVPVYFPGTCIKRERDPIFGHFKTNTKSVGLIRPAFRNRRDKIGVAMAKRITRAATSKQTQIALSVRAPAGNSSTAFRDYARTGTLAVRSSLPQLTHAPLIARRIAFQMQ